MTPTRLLATGLSLAAVAALAACGNSSSGKSSTATAAGRAVRYDAPVSLPVHQEPPLTLRNYDGRPVDLSSYRGRAVLVTFIYDHCPDTCPLIVGNLHTSLGLLGARAGKVKIVAVSTDPRGDTPATVKRFLAQHQMTGKMDYLIGSPAQLSRVWSRWGIAAQRSKQQPELVAHSALIYGIGASGKLRVAYPANFKPAWIAHDVPLLAAQ